MQAYHNSADRLCLAFSVAFNRIVNSDFLCYQVYESDAGPGRLLVAAPYPWKIQLMHKQKSPPPPALVRRESRYPKSVPSRS